MFILLHNGCTAGYLAQLNNQVRLLTQVARLTKLAPQSGEVKLKFTPLKVIEGNLIYQAIA